MPTEKFNKYKYQNLICQYELSGLEARILFRLSNVYGQDGKIYASNTKIAIWLGKLTQEDFEKPNKTKKEKDKIKNVKRSIQNAVSKLSPKFLDTEINDKNNGRNIFLKNPDTGARYEGVINSSPPADKPSKVGVIKSSPGGDQTITGGCIDDHPLIIKTDSNNDFNEEMLPQGIFLKKYGDKIPNGIIGGFRNEQLEEYYEKYDDEFAEICFAAEKIKCSQRRRYVQGAINKLNSKAQMANEQKAIDEKAQHDIDITMMSNEVSKLANTMFESV